MVVFRLVLALHCLHFSATCPPGASSAFVFIPCLSTLITRHPWAVTRVEPLCALWGSHAMHNVSGVIDRNRMCMLVTEAWQRQSSLAPHPTSSLFTHRDGHITARHPGNGSSSASYPV